MNQDVEQYLRLYVNYRQDDWADWLALAEFTINNRQQSATGYSPFLINYGRHPRASFTPDAVPNVESVSEFVTRMKELYRVARLSLEHAAETMKGHYDKKHKSPPSLKVGDKVWLDGSDLRTLRPSKKLDVKRLGPFKITKQISPVNFQLKLPFKWRLHTSTFHVSKLRLALEDPVLHPQSQPSPPDLVDNHLEYEVHKILDTRLTSKGLQYLVAWKGYGPEENTWEPLSNLTHAQDLVSEFHLAHPQAPRNIGRAFLQIPFRVNPSLVVEDSP